MVKEITIDEFFLSRNTVPVIDVRSPSEYRKGHIPGAFNIPLLNDEERSRVGTVYKQKGKIHAVKLALEILGPQMLIKAKEGEKIAGTERKLIVHCWRGGMRSENMAWLFSRLGIDCYTLAGGYKTYRRYGRNLIQNPLNLIVLGGMTGSGKTELLNILEENNEQVLNLEMKAHHKGSAFGSIGQEKQYETEHFENLIFEKVRQFDLSRPVWIEDESKHIGKNCIPDELFAQMRRSPVIKIIMPKKHRVKRLVDEYSEFGDEYLRYSILKIDKRLGGVKANQALGALEQKDYETVASIVLDYYDKAYNFGLSKRAESTIFQIELPEDTPRDNASKILAFAEKKLTGNIVF